MDKRKEPVRVLHVFGRLDLGGAESRTMDLYRNMDRDNVQFDFLTHTVERQYYEDEAMALGARVFNVPRFKGTNLHAYKNALEEFFKAHAHEWQFVHGHMTSTASVYLPIAKKYGAGTIAHSRSAGTEKGLKSIATDFFQRPLKKEGTVDFRFACSDEAAIAVFGRKLFGDGKIKIIPNAIMPDKYLYNEKTREKIRMDFGIRDSFVIGHVGRFHEAKNHPYLIKIFAALKKMCDENKTAQKPVLLLIGDGEKIEEIRTLVRDIKLESDVIFAGRRSDVNACLQAMDIFVFPSVYEGLPGSVIEAQAAGLYCLVSDRVTKMSLATPYAKSMRIDVSPSEWAKKIFSFMTDSVHMTGNDSLNIAADNISVYTESSANTAVNSIGKAYEDINTAKASYTSSNRMAHSKGAINILKEKGFDAAMQARWWEKFYTVL